jgi:thioredoxin-related protein
MKKVLVLLTSALVFLSFSGLSQDVSKVKWHTIEEAEKLNQQQPRKIMIDVYTDWCGWCKKMDKETFNHPVIADYINQYFYPVKLDAESKEEIVFNGTTYKFVAQGARGYHELAAGLLNGKMSYPSIAYMNEKKELLGAIPGYYTPDRIEPLLNYIVEEKYISQSLEEYQKTFVSKIRVDKTTID